MNNRGINFSEYHCCSSANLVILFLISLTYLDNADGVEISENRYQMTINKVLNNTFAKVNVASRITCCGYCDQTSGCLSVNFDNTSKECQLSKEPLVAVSVNGNTDLKWNIYSKEDWMIVFRGTPGGGGDIYTAWVDGTSVTTDDVTCMTTDVTSCTQHYRNPIVDSWTSIGVTQVKFAFYKDNDEVAFIIFAATGSDIKSWFTNSSIIQSSWTNITSDNFNIFSIFGHDSARRFMINRSYGGCPADTTYSVVVTANVHGCTYDAQTSYPQFIYANTETYGFPETMSGMDIADAMAIFIK